MFAKERADIWAAFQSFQLFPAMAKRVDTILIAGIATPGIDDYQGGERIFGVSTCAYVRSVLKSVRPPVGSQIVARGAEPKTNGRLGIPNALAGVGCKMYKSTCLRHRFSAADPGRGRAVDADQI